MATQTASQQFSQREYVAPFGRYEGTRPTEFPANEVLVGRERERARMMDWLLTFGNRGAYLVTGYRGVGKSSFVHFCVKQYEDDVYGRYLQTKAGRSLFWDRIAVCTIVAFGLFTPVMASQLLRGFWHRDWTAWLLLRWVVAAPLLLLALYPLVRSLLIFSRASSKAGAGWHASWALASVGLAALVFLVSLLLSGPEAVAFCLASLCWTYLCVRGLSVNLEKHAGGALDHDPGGIKYESGEPSRRRVAASWAVGFFFLAGSVPLMRASAHAGASLALRYGTVAACCAWCGWCVRWRDIILLHEHLRAGTHPLGARGLARTFTVHLALTTISGASLVAWLSWLACFAAGRRQLVEAWPAAVLAGSSFAFLAGCFLWRRSVCQRSPGSGRCWFYFHPRPRLVVALKAVFGMLLGAQILDDLCGNPAQLWLATGPSGMPRWAASRPAFADWRAEVLWLALAAVFVAALMYLEQDWIARRNERNRQDDAYDNIPFKREESTRLGHQHLNREFATATTFWTVFRVWLPVITVRVNLGFDNLNHTQVIAAMLGGLQSSYRRNFLAWRSRLGLLWTALATATLLVLGVALGSAAEIIVPDVRYLQWTLPLPTAINSARAPDHLHLLEMLVPLNRQRHEFGLNGYQATAFGILFVLARTLGTRLRIPYHRALYGRLTRLLDSLSSTVRRTRGAPQVRFAPAGMAFEVPTDSAQVDTPPQDPRTIEQAFLDILRDLQDPYVPLPMAGHLLSLPAPQITFIFDELDKIGVRTGERALDGATVSDSGDRERSARIHRLLADLKNLLSTAPARFIFVGGRELHDEWLADLTARQPLLSNVFDGEIYLPTLLADRLDVDRPRQRPLDRIHACLNAQLSRNHALYARAQRRRRWGDQWFDVFRNEAEHVFVQEPNYRGPYDSPEQPATPARATSSFWRAWRARAQLFGFTLGSVPDGDEPKSLPTLKLHAVPSEASPTDSGSPRAYGEGVAWQEDFFQQFVEYLALRSRGNPKRLHGLMERFVQPVGRVVRNAETRWSHFECQHVLRFSHVERFSIQLLANIYRRLQPVVRARVDFGDDKIIRSALYLADFLFKFHRRAFSWSSLERIDELLHVHRAPDLRGFVSELLFQWSQCFLHPILEGMHAFRFRSEVAAEVRYISRIADAEMAAFNFTLDEAQALKSEYQVRLARMVKEQESCFELRAALGELDDFDENYEEARRHYAAAIAELDARADASKIGGFIVGHSTPPGERTVGRKIGWVVARLRLMLQVGLTYERSHNYERAFAEYRDARALSQETILSLLDQEGQRVLAQRWLQRPDGKDRPGTGSALGLQTSIERPNRLETLTHFPILFQALFASAWVAEKSVCAVDSSLNMVEEALADARASLPHVRSEDAGPPAADGAHAQFFLATANLHHNAGNLYFFKGHQAGKLSGHGAAVDVEGYLPHAARHYSRALRDVRTFCTLHWTRARPARGAGALVAAGQPTSSPPTLRPSAPPESRSTMPSPPSDVATPRSAPPRKSTPIPTPIPAPADSGPPSPPPQSARHNVEQPPRPRLWPEFVLRRTAAALLGLADVVLGSVSLAHLSTETPPPQGDDERKREQRERVDFTEWLAGATSWRAEALIVAPGSHPSQGDGAWPGVRRYLSLATWGAYLLEAGGHYEEAARERIWSAQCVETLAWSLKAYAQLMGLEPAKDGSHQLLLAGEHALGHALGLIARAAGGKQEGAREGGDGEPAQEERREPSVPWHAKRIARSLGLLAAHLDDELAPRFAARAGDDAATTPREGWAATFRGALVRGLERNAYSMLNHLMTLQVLVLDTALDDEKKGKKLEDGQPFVDELTRLKTDYSSPMHFTPFHYGTAVLAWVLECQSLTENAPGKERLLRPLRESARLALARSREMYNCGDAYYEMIAELSYLDDDFNDRCIHVHHALQMMGAELTNALLARCAADDEERGRGPLADDRPLAQERLPGQAPAQGAGRAG